MGYISREVDRVVIERPFHPKISISVGDWARIMMFAHQRVQDVLGCPLPAEQLREFEEFKETLDLIDRTLGA